MEHKILCFKVSDDSEETQRNLTGPPFFLIAVAEHSYGEIANILEEKRVKHFLTQRGYI